MAILVHRFFNDTLVQITLLLILLDLALGIIASVVKGTFQLSYIADFARNDLLGKVVPFFLVYGGYVYATHAKIVIPGLNLVVIKDGMWVLVSAALVASLLKSLKDLGFLSGVTDAIAGADPNAKITG